MIWRVQEGRAIPERAIIAKELANLLGALAHPHRVRIIEELRSRDMDVNSIQQILGISHSSVSQNLSVLRSQRLVQERREGRRVIYRLTKKGLADWLLGGLEFLENRMTHGDEVREALTAALEKWGARQGQRRAPRE
jgi:DNA-binding transcriptional ArsR family regulator